MLRKGAFFYHAVLLFALPGFVSAAILQCDAGGGALQAGWTRVQQGTNINVADTGINVTLSTGEPSAIAARNTGGSGPLADVETDFYFADNETQSPGSDFILTLGNLPAGNYLLKSYHNRSTEDPTIIPAVTVTGATDVTVPASIVQDHPIMESPAQVLFTADGVSDVVIRYQGPDGGCPGCQAFFNGFELETANLSSAQAEQVTVDYEVTGGTAQEGVDYSIFGGPVNFSPGQTTGTIIILVNDDGLEEDDETIELTLTGVTGGDVVLGGLTQHTYTIIDPRPDVEFASPTGIAGEDAGQAQVSVVLSHTWQQTVTVNYSVAGGTAVNGVDYTVDNGVLTFDPCQTLANITLNILDDANQEGPETIELTLSQPNNAKLGEIDEHTLTIQDDELPGSFTNSIGMEFILVSPGSFQMGSESGEWNEKPVHKVTISDYFYISRDEVTAAQYRAFDPGYSGSGYATGLSWYDANDFAQWLSQQEAVSYRLPTEAEWEYACRYASNINNMLSSPREWVYDWYGEYSYQSQTDPVGPNEGMARVVRGGGLDDDSSYYFRCTYRAGIAPGFAGGQHDIGFRLVVADMPNTSPESAEPPFVRQGIKENAAQVTQAPDPAEPYFNQRPLFPIPPDNASREEIDAAGLHPSFRGHNHSPGMEVCPNGDVLVIIYTSYSEYEPEVSLMAARLRFGSDQWDTPTPMFDFPGANDHAPMLWNDNGTLYFFWGCPRLDGASPYPFQWRTSTDSGATWSEVKFPEFVGSIGSHSRQPINTALRDGNTIYVSSDGSGGESVLWKSDDNGLTWYDPGGRTGGRHTTFVFLNNGDILGMGGKSTNINGYMPKSISSDGAQSWSVSSTPFNWLGGNQRPCVIRLKSGNLFFCSDFQKSFDCDQYAGATQYGCFVALSDDDGQTWTVKKITSALPHECNCWDCGNVGTLGYSVARQAPNGIIHVISTMNHPCQHYEMNEEWILDETAPASPPPDPGTSGTVDSYQEDYPGGQTKATWSAKTCTDGRYLLHGTETWYYEDGTKQYEAQYYNGKKINSETYWGPDGRKAWLWDHNEPDGTSTWTQYWSNGLKKVESNWQYGGKIADGNAYHWDRCGQPLQAWNFDNGNLTASIPLPPPQINITADITGDCFVDTNDLKVISQDWLKAGRYIPAAEPDNNSLVLHYAFDESSGTTLSDSSGHGYTGVFFTDVDRTPAEISARMDTGKSGNSFHFSALIMAGGVSIPPELFTENDISREITVAAWIRNAHPAETPDSGAFMWEFRQWDGVSTSGGARVLAVETTDRNGNFVFHDDSDSVAYSLNWPAETEWKHYAFVRDAAKLKVYVNGSLEAEASSSGNAMAQPGLLYCGISADRAPGNATGLHDGFTGNMDDFKIYEYAT